MGMQQLLLNVVLTFIFKTLPYIQYTVANVILNGLILYDVACSCVQCI